MHIHPLRLSAAVVALVIALMAMTGCRRGPVEARLDLADSLMESRPDSALTILDSISAADLRGDAQKARYALLLSMALDKNYIDTTTFDVLQPAIDYYPRHGSPDEKLRTYYYQGRIYQNAHLYDEALRAYYDGLEASQHSIDTLTVARLLVAQGFIMESYLNMEEYVSNNLRAAKLFQEKNRFEDCADCYLNALYGSLTIDSLNLADSIFAICEELYNQEHITFDKYFTYKLNYIQATGTTDELRNILNQSSKLETVSGDAILDMADCYLTTGDPYSAKYLLDYYSDAGLSCDSLKYPAVATGVYEALGDYANSLQEYQRFSNMFLGRHVEVYRKKLEQNDERHRLEIHVEKERNARRNLFGGTAAIICILTLVVIILLQKRQKDAATTEALRHRITNLEAEHDRLEEILQSDRGLPAEVKQAIKERVKILNSFFANEISAHDGFTKSFESATSSLLSDSESFMNSTRLAFKATHPKFMEYLEEHGLTEAEINYVCLYAIGLRGKEVGEYIRSSRHYHLSSDIRRKLGIDGHQTNIGIYICKLMAEFDN